MYTYLDNVSFTKIISFAHAYHGAMIYTCENASGCLKYNFDKLNSTIPAVEYACLKCRSDSPNAKAVGVVF